MLIPDPPSVAPADQACTSRSKMISPVFEKLADQYPTLEFFKCDIDVQEDVAAEVGIKAMPTFIFYKNGEQVGKVMGADPTKLKVRPLWLRSFGMDG